MITPVPEQLNQLNENTHPDENFVDQLETTLRTRHTQHQQSKATHTYNPIFWQRYPISSVASITVLVLILALLPPVQTFAMTILDSLFNRSNANEMTITRDLNETSNDESGIIAFAELEAISEYDVQLPSTIPANYLLTESGYSENRDTVNLYYEAPGRGLIITQQPLASVDYGLLTDGDFGIGADSPIAPVTVGEFAGEYVEGAWLVEDQQINDENNTVTTQVIWNQSVSMRTLRWIEDDMIFEIRAMGGSEGNRYIGLEEMIDIALSME